MKYVTYDANGNLTGAYWQDLLPEHAANHIEVTDDQYAIWTSLVLVNGALALRPPPPRDLGKERAQAWEAIKAKREDLSDNGGYTVTVAGVAKWFHSDGKSKTQQLALVMMGANVPAVQWKTMDGTFVTMSQPLAGAIFQAAAAQDMAIFNTAETHRVAMEAAAEPLAYDFSAGWPATFPG